MNDDLLIEQTLAGDRDAFGKLALKYQDRVFNLALPIVGNPEDALDVTLARTGTHSDLFGK